MKKKIKITGIVTPANWDKDGNVIQISIQTTNEEEFVVEKSRIGSELMAHLQSKIEAVGATRRRLDGKTIMRVETYHLFSG